MSRGGGTQTGKTPDIAQRLLEVIQHLQISAAEFGRRCDLPYSTLQSYLRAERVPNEESLKKLVTHLHINVNWLLTGEGVMFPPATTYIEGAGRLFMSPAKEQMIAEDPGIYDVLENICDLLDGMDRGALEDVQRYISKEKQNIEMRKMLEELKKKDCG